MEKQDIQSSLLKQGNIDDKVPNKTIAQQATNSIFHQIDLLDLDQYRVKSHCHYDPSLVNTANYSVFQIEIINEELQRFYQGRYILEVWNKQGERIYQKVLKDEISQWKLYNNTLLFKGSNESPLIYILYLEDKKMIALRHPYDDNREVDMIYFDNYLIVAQQFNFRFIQINPEEITTTISQFLNPDEAHQPLFEKEFSGIIQNDRIFQMIPNPLRNELLFICVAENFQIIYYKFVANKSTEKRQVQLQKIEFDQSQKKKSKLDKKQQKLLEALHDIQQITLMVKNQSVYLLILRKNQVLEIVENFVSPIYVEQRLNMTKILPLFGEKVAFQFSDGSIQQAISIDKISERQFIQDSLYYKQLTMPPTSTTMHDVMSRILFYEDAIIINQRLFLLRDNIIFVVDTFTKQVVQRFTQRQKVVSLHKLKSQTEDERGYKQTVYKVIALHKNGSFQVLQTQDHNLYTEWVRSEVNQTNILQQKEVVLSAFQNQNTFSSLYITALSQTAQGSTVKIYQMLFNTQLIELKVQLKKDDNIFIVNSISRQREMIGIVDVKYFAIYRNDKGNLVKLYQLNHTRFEFRDQISNNSMFYFQKEYILAISKKTIFKINIATNQIEQSKLSNSIRPTGNLFIDASYFYFITEGDQEGKSKLGVADNLMIEASFADQSKDDTKKAIEDKNKSSGSNKLQYPTWQFDNQIKRMDYDETNNILNLHLTNYQVIQVPLLHRNTLSFIGLAERSYYLAFKKLGEHFYALDKGNYLNCWSMINGQLLSRTYVDNADYKYYDTDKDVYDKDWFQYNLVYRPNEASPNSLDDKTIQQLRTYKILEIDQRGVLTEKMTFVHPVQRSHNTHLYFSNDLMYMIEVLVNKQDKSQSTYNLYTLENPLIHKWRFVKTLNTDNKSIEWHHKSFFPYNLNLKTLEPINQESIQTYDTYKFLDKDRIKILNTQDGIEMIYNIDTKKVEGYMALQYSFTNTKESFYDKKCGHFYVQEITSRLQNFYESLRRKIYLENKVNPRLRSLDVSARDYKYKYLIEQGYTNLDYQFYLQFIQGKDSNLLRSFKQMSNDHIQKMVHNIFPDGNTTILHKIAESDKGFEVIDYLRQLSKKEGFVIPFMLNQEQLTPLDISVQRRDFKQSNSLVKMLSKTPMDHHSRIISHLLPKLIDMNLPALEKYFDKRRFQSGVCKTITLGRINIQTDQDNKVVPTTLFNNSQNEITQALMNPKKKEQSLNLDILDVPLHQYKGTELGFKAQSELEVNEYEIKLVKSLANSDNQDLFNQRTIRAFIDYVWPHTRLLILKNVFLPYLAFILYYMIYLVIMKKLNITQEQDPTFFNFTAGTFNLYEGMFKIILFLGCFYFFQQDFQQIKSFANNAIVLWSYANIFPLILMIFIIVYDMFIDSGNSQLEKTFYSASSFFIWIRVVHMMKCFDHTALLLRIGADILHRMRYLIAFIVISLLAFGFTFYFVSEQRRMVGIAAESPFDGIQYMFQVLIGQYDAEVFDNAYLSILLVLVNFFNVFFIFTLIIALTVSSFSNDTDIKSNQAYQDKASLIALYSYLMNEFAIRDPSKRYLLIATVTEGKKGKSGSSSNGLFSSGDSRNAQAKMMKTMDRRLNNLTVKVEKTLKDISDRLDSVSQQNQQQ